MIIYTDKSIFDTPAQALVNPVNCEGVMGAGLAKQFKIRYSEMYQSYLKQCPLVIGELHVWISPKKTIVNFPTKEHWRQPSRLDYIEKGLDKFLHLYGFCGIKSVAFPKLGCGKGGLNWDEVKPVMVKHLEGLDIPVWICE